MAKNSKTAEEDTTTTNTTTNTSTTTTTNNNNDPAPTTTTPSPQGGLDGGWGWVVVACSFVVSVLVDGVCFSIGVFFTPLRHHFLSSKAQTAWVGSVLNGTYLSVGPIVGAFVNRYGCRKVTMAGAVIASTSFFLSTFSTSIPLLIVIYGFLGGVGFGFIYLPAMVMVGLHFEKKRALATGIACCGSGIGAFVFAPLCDFLLDLYGWQGATWILAAVTLHGMVCGLFYRPLPSAAAAAAGALDLEGGKEKEGEEGEEGEQSRPLLGKRGGGDNGDGEEEEENRAAAAAASGGLREKKAGGGEGGGQVGDADNHHPPSPSSSKVVIPDICIEVTAPSDENIAGHFSPSAARNGEGPETAGVTSPDALPDQAGKKAASQQTGDAQENLPVQLRNKLPKNSRPERPLSDVIYTVTPQIQPMEGDASQTFRSELALKAKVSPLARLAYSQDAFAMTRTRKKPASPHHPHHKHLEVSRPLLRKDIFYSGSLRHIPEYKSAENLEEYRRKMIDIEELQKEEKEEEEEEEEEGAVGRWGKRVRWLICGSLKQVFDVTLIRSPTFLIYGFSCFLCMLGFFVPFIYLPTLCIDLGLGSSKAAFLISIIGIANTIGRVAVGFLSDQPWADCLLINNVALVIGGAATCFVPFFSLYAIFATYTYLFGTCIAVFVSLRSIILVDLMGVEKLTNSFGLIIMCQGISTFIGAPIAGMLADLTGDYNISFYMAGMFIALSGVICLPLRRIAHWENSRDQSATKSATKTNKRPKALNDVTDDAPAADVSGDPEVLIHRLKED